MSSAYLRIGQIVRPHGVHGAVKLVPLTDDPRRFSGLAEAFLEQDGAYSPIRVFDAGVRPDAVTLRIAGVDTPEDAQELRGRYLCVDRAHAASLPEGSYFVCDLIGCEVFDSEGASYGRITDVLETGANDVYEVDGGKLMVPALKRVLRSVDTARGRVELDADTLREVGLFAD